MPVYDYRCQTCDTVFPVEAPLGSLDDSPCPHCGGRGKRVFAIFENPPEIGGGACSTHGCNEKSFANFEEMSKELLAQSERGTPQEHAAII